MSTLGQVILRDVLVNRPTASIIGRLFCATDTSVLYRDNGSTWDQISFAAFRIGVSYAGTPPNSATLSLYTFTDSVTFPANFSGSGGTVGTNPTATTTCNVTKNGSNVGTIVVSTGGVVTFTTSGGTSLSYAIGDRLSVIAPSVADVTLANPAFTLNGIRN